MASRRLACVAVGMLVLRFHLTHLAHAQDAPGDYVAAHNMARAQVGVEPLSWHPDLQATAQSYANQLAVVCNLQHSMGQFGENLYMGPGNEIDAVRMWTDEMAFYDHGTNSCQAGKTCGHYTQVVWRDTQSVGCGLAQCTDGYNIVVCHYNPRGNWVGKWPF